MMMEIHWGWVIFIGILGGIYGYYHGIDRKRASWSKVRYKYNNDWTQYDKPYWIYVWLGIGVGIGFGIVTDLAATWVSFNVPFTGDGDPYIPLYGAHRHHGASSA